MTPGVYQGHQATLIKYITTSQRQLGALHGLTTPRNAVVGSLGLRYTRLFVDVAWPATNQIFGIVSKYKIAHKKMAITLCALSLSSRQTCQVCE
jgi:hypothetical protein